MAYVLYDDGFDSHPKVLEALAHDPGSITLHVLCNLWTAKTTTPGVVTLGAVVAKAGSKTRGLKWARVLVAVGLWHAAGHACDACPQPPQDGYVFHDYGDWNPNVVAKAGQREELSRTRAEAGRKGAEARWRNGSNGSPKPPRPSRKGGNPDGKPDGNSVANPGFANGNGWQADGNPVATGWQVDAPSTEVQGSGQLDHSPPGSNAGVRDIERPRMPQRTPAQRLVAKYGDGVRFADVSRAIKVLGEALDQGIPERLLDGAVGVLITEQRACTHEALRIAMLKAEGNWGPAVGPPKPGNPYLDDLRTRAVAAGDSDTPLLWAVPTPPALEA